MLRTTLVLTLAAISATALAGKRTYKVDNNRLVVTAPILFETGKDTLKSESAEAIAFVADYLADKKYVSTMRIEVHSDSTGSEEFNHKLTTKRAFAIGKVLIARGVDCKRLVAVGFGSSKPIADNGTPEGKAQNRRSEFVNAALKGKLIGGESVDGGGRSAGDLCAT